MKSKVDRHGIWGGMNMTVLRAFALGKNWLTPQRRPVVGSWVLSLFRLLLRMPTPVHGWDCFGESAPSRGNRMHVFW